MPCTRFLQNRDHGLYTFLEGFAMSMTCGDLERWLEDNTMKCLLKKIQKMTFCKREEGDLSEPLWFSQ